jgi:hypothetical protein
MNMSQRRFYLQLIFLSLAVAIALYFLHLLPQLAAYARLSWIGLVFFIVLSVVMYEVGYQAAASDNKHNFTNTVIGFTIGKMMIAILIILGYLKLAEPETKLFVLPFFGIYLIYTIFETYFMIRLGKMDSKS